MARSVTTDPFRCFRFAPRVGFEGEALGVSKVVIEPGVPWQGRGEVILESAWKPEIIDFAKRSKPFPLIVGIYHVTDDFGAKGEPSGTVVLTDVTPTEASMTLTPLDAAEDEIFKVTLRMSYNRLTFIFGTATEGTILDRIESVT